MILLTVDSYPFTLLLYTRFYKSTFIEGEPIGTALYAAQKIGSITDAASKIEPIMDDMKDIIDNVVARAAVRAAERPKGRAYIEENTSGELDQAQVQVRDNMSSQIGSVVAGYLMQSIQGKITAPLVNIPVTAGVNKILKNYERNAGEELNILSAALAAKQTESRMHIQQGSKVTGNPEDVVAGNGSIMLANAANDQATLPAIQEETTLGINSADSKLSDESMQQIAAKINQPLYLFEDGVLKASYGKGLNGDIIAVDYDSTQGAYRNLIQQDASNYRASQGQMSRSVVYLPNIYSALASGTQGKYTAQDLLQLQQANYNAAIAPSNGYRGVYDFYAPTPSSLAASNQNEYNPYASRYRDGVSGDANAVPLYDVTRQYKTGLDQDTDSRVRQVADYPLSGGTSSVSRAGSFFSGIDFSPEQNSPTDRIAGTDFYGRPASSFSVTRDNNSQSTFGYVVSELFGIQSAQAAVPFVIGAGAAEALTYSAGALGLGTAWWSLNNAATGASEYKATSNYSRENSYQPALTGNLMTSGMNTGLFANPVDQMRFDGTMPEVDEQTPRTNIVANKGRTMPIRETETSSLLKGMDTSSDRPAITDFSIQHKPKSILPTYTPDQSTELAELTRLPGFSPSMLEAWQESFPDDSHKLEEFSNLPGFTPIHTNVPTVETFPDQRYLIDDLDMSVLLREYDYFILNGQNMEDATSTPEQYTGDLIEFSKRQDARDYGDTETIRGEANKFFKKAHGGDKTLDFKVTKTKDGKIVMEYTDKAENQGYTKRYVRILDSNGNKLESYSEGINPKGRVHHRKSR